MSESDINAVAQRYITVHGSHAWLKTALIADRHYSDGEMERFKAWVLITNRVNELLPDCQREELQ